MPSLFNRKQKLLRLNLARYQGNGYQQASVMLDCACMQIKVKPSLNYFALSVYFLLLPQLALEELIRHCFQADICSVTPKPFGTRRKAFVYNA